MEWISEKTTKTMQKSSRIWLFIKLMTKKLIKYVTSVYSVHKWQYTHTQSEHIHVYAFFSGIDLLRVIEKKWT